MNLGFVLSQLNWQIVLLGALSLSVGWGIRGNFGHEYGAAIPGALAAMAVVLMSGRADWWPRIHYFAMFGALGWSFGGSMSYMQVVSYTHSGYPGSVLYGFGNLFVIGFLWAFLGGAGVALPAFLSGEQLGLFFVPLTVIFIGWFLQSIIVDWLFTISPMRRHENPLYWYDTDWLATLVALGATLAVIALRGGMDVATNLLLHMTLGWFVAFLVLVNVLKLRMTPPRGDNWAGCVGMVGGVLVYCWQQGLGGMALAALVTGTIGGIGFALGQFIKILGIRTGQQTNWHSVMEQTQGFLHGVGLAVGMALVAGSAPVLSLAGRSPAWTSSFAVLFVLIGLTYLNHRKAALTWIDQVTSLPDRFYGLPVTGWFRHSRGWVGWFELFYLVLGAGGLLLLWVHQRHSLPILPKDWLGQGQLLYVVFLWWVVIFNFERALVGFTPQRIVTEGFIAWNAIVCTVLLVGAFGASARQPIQLSYSEWILDYSVMLFGVSVIGILILWGLTHAVYGKAPIPHSGTHIRFGSDATATKVKPAAGQKHP